jgi:hypothetical protein
VDLSTLLPKAGGTMTGALILATNPTVGLQASTKDYVDTSRADCQSYLNATLLGIGGGYMYSPIGLFAGAFPTLDAHVTHKAYVDAKFTTVSNQIATMSALLTAHGIV